MLLRKVLILLAVLALGLTGLAPVARAADRGCATCISACDSGCDQEQSSKACQPCVGVAQGNLAIAVLAVRETDCSTESYQQEPELRFDSLASRPSIAPPRV